MEKAYPGSLRHWEIYGVDIVLAADGTAYARFVGWSQKIEIGGAKVIVPLEDTDQRNKPCSMAFRCSCSREMSATQPSKPA
jgi:hypothetical protein